MVQVIPFVLYAIIPSLSRYPPGVRTSPTATQYCEPSYAIVMHPLGKIVAKLPDEAVQPVVADEFAVVASRKPSPDMLVCPAATTKLSVGAVIPLPPPPPENGTPLL
jgi:hypothetical protein